MFKTKKPSPKFPDTPKPPTWQMMKDDIELASKMDILFTLRTEYEKDLPVTSPSSNEEQSSSRCDPVPSEEVLRLAMALSWHRLKFDEGLNVLEERRHNLNQRSLHLKETVKNVKQQALTAMSKS